MVWFYLVIVNEFDNPIPKHPLVSLVHAMSTCELEVEAPKDLREFRPQGTTWTYYIDDKEEDNNICGLWFVEQEYKTVCCLLVWLQYRIQIQQRKRWDVLDLTSAWIQISHIFILNTKIINKSYTI